MLPWFIGFVACRGGVTAPEVAEPYGPTSPFLPDPTRNLPLITNTTAFLERGRDDGDGGFYIYVDDDGEPTLPD